MTQELPKWVEDKKTDPPKRRPKAPSPADAAKAKGWKCAGCFGNVAGSLPRCPVCGNRKPKSALAPKPPKPKPPKPKEPQVIALHVEVTVHGTMSFDIEGKQAHDIAAALTQKPTVDGVLDALDPWISGLKVQHEISIIEDPVMPGDSYSTWYVREEQGTVEVQTNGGFLPRGWSWLDVEAK